MSTLPATSIEIVWQRAGSRCEYCQLHQDEDDVLSFHIDHIIAIQHGGTDDHDNLCLSCSHCNWQKGPNLSGLLNGKLYALFNPRKQNWHPHFEWDQTLLIGKTATGTVTVQVLDINCSEYVMRREELLLEGRFPPNDS
jgi:hypothetical protein